MVNLLVSFTFLQQDNGLRLVPGSAAGGIQPDLVPALTGPADESTDEAEAITQDPKKP